MKSNSNFKTYIYSNLLFMQISTLWIHFFFLLPQVVIALGWTIESQAPAWRGYGDREWHTNWLWYGLLIPALNSEILQPGLYSELRGNGSEGEVLTTQAWKLEFRSPEYKVRRGCKSVTLGILIANVTSSSLTGFSLACSSGLFSTSRSRIISPGERNSQDVALRESFLWSSNPSFPGIQDVPKGCETVHSIQRIQEVPENHQTH